MSRQQSMGLALEPCPDCGSPKHKSCKWSNQVSDLKTPAGNPIVDEWTEEYDIPAANADDTRRLIEQVSDLRADLAVEKHAAAQWAEKHKELEKLHLSECLRLEKELADARALAEWRPITPESLPNRGDEALCLPSDTHGSMVLTVGFDSRGAEDAPRYLSGGYTHYRPISPPKEGSHD